MAIFWITDSNRRERNEDGTVVRRQPVKYTPIGCQIAVELSTATLFDNSPTATQSLQVALQKVVAPIARPKGKGKFYGLAERPMSEKRPASGIRLNQFCSSARSEDIVREQVASIPALVKDAVVGLFGDARSATESSADAKALPVIQTVDNWSVSKAFPNSAFFTSVERSVQ